MEIYEKKLREYMKLRAVYKEITLLNPSVFVLPLHLAVKDFNDNVQRFDVALASENF